MKNRLAVCVGLLRPVLLLSIPIRLFGTDLSVLDTGRNVRIAMIGQGPLCNAKVVTPSAAVVTLKLSEAAQDCGGKDELIYISAGNVAEIVPQRRLTKGRVLGKVLLGCAGIAALAIVPLTSSDPESLLILGNWAIPGLVFYGAWKAVPRRSDYLLMMTCSDRRHCVSKSDSRQLGLP